MGSKNPSDEAVSALARQAAATGGLALGPVPADSHPWARELIRQFNAAEDKAACPHLHAQETAGIWFAVAPDLIACMDCAQDLIARVEARLGQPLSKEPARCNVCDRKRPVRGVSVAAGRYLLRGLLCGPCHGADPAAPADERVASQEDIKPPPAALAVLDLEPILVDREALTQATDREPFDQLGWEMLVRAGRLSEKLVNAVGRRADGASQSLDLDQAVVGGLLVRTAKLTHSIFEATQRESEAHSPLSRCLGETTITLRWLVSRSDAQIYRRFRADSFARWRQLRAEDMDGVDATARTIRDAVLAHVESDLAASGLTWDDVPARPNSWGPDTRQRFEAFDQGWLYDTLFVTHSNYVHPTWHEIRAFHLRTDDDGLHLDATRAGMAPTAAYVLARLVAEACLDAASVLPHHLDDDALAEVVASTIRASQELSVAFAEFARQGGLEPDLRRHWRADGP